MPTQARNLESTKEKGRKGKYFNGVFIAPRHILKSYKKRTMGL